MTIVPHTAAETTMDNFSVGQKVNLEVDVIARYLERLVIGQKEEQPESSVTMDLLAKSGFLN